MSRTSSTVPFSVVVSGGPALVVTGMPSATRLAIVSSVGIILDAYTGGRLPIAKAAAVAEPGALRATDVLKFLKAREQEMVDMLCQLVQVESPSGNWRALAEMAEMLAAEFGKLGGNAKLHSQEKAGDHLQIDFSGKNGDPVLLLGHYDTVWEVGTLASMLCRVDRGRVWGPGTFDMKGGIVQMMFALRALLELRGELPRPVTVLLVSDEEVGSETSRPLTEAL